MPIFVIAHQDRWRLDRAAVQKSSGFGKFYEEIGRSLYHLLMLTCGDRCNQFLDSNAN
ncbi:MAG: hypothetical protein LH702_16050 [Phormidesmis sp. CAN_BIN44]|nr:hypothetical protein [Phormidesmis sp. CAN_BIN44]